MRAAASWAWKNWDAIDFAARRFSAAGQRPDPLDRLLDWMIALESILCRGDGSVSYRVSTRAAILLGHDLPLRLALQKQVGALYGLRSKIVHGSHQDLERTLKKMGDARAVGLQAYEIVRDVFLKLPEHPVLLDREGLVALSLMGFAGGLPDKPIGAVEE